MTPTSRERQLAFLVLPFMPLFFSSNLVIGRAAVETVEPFTLACLRWAIACACLLPFTISSIYDHRQTLRRHWRRIAILAFLGMWICGAVVYIGLTMTTATNGTLIYTTSPVIILLLERLFRGRRIGGREAFGVALAFAGVIAIVVRGSLAVLLGIEFNAGDLLIAAGALSWAAYSIILKDDAFAGIPTLTLFAVIAGAGALMLAPFMAGEIVVTKSFPATLPQWASITGVAFLASILAFSTYQYGVKIVGPAITAVFMYLLPPYGVVMAVIFLGEPLALYHLAGMIMVTVGVALATAPPDLIQRLRRG